MERVSGWYKRDAQRNALILACVITVALNADTVRIAKTLWTSPTVSAVVVEQAKARAERSANPQDPAAAPAPPTAPMQALTDQEQALLGEVTGWSGDPMPPHGNVLDWVWLALRTHLLGWVLTAIAVSLGAPFWFDTLNRFINLRSAGRVPDKGTVPPTPAQAGGGGD
jgi:hypothetical protein